MSAFIKKYKAKNGATVIQVVFKDGRQVVKTVHIGTAHDEAEEAELKALANDTIHAGQLVLDIFEDDSQGLDITLEATYSSVLWNALSKVYDSLGFDKLADEIFKQLVLARIIKPASKIDTIRILADLGLDAPSNAGIHRCLKRST